MSSFKDTPEFSIEKIYLVSEGVEKVLEIAEVSEKSAPSVKDKIYLVGNGAEREMNVIATSIVGSAMT